MSYTTVRVRALFFVEKYIGAFCQTAIKKRL